MGLFDKIKQPIFLKDVDSAEAQLQALQELAKTSSGPLMTKLEQDIRYLEAGITGENAIKYELRNSHIPMFVLHDLYLEYDELSVQIDFLIITRKHNFIVECKNLYGDIEITAGGDFVRTVTYGHNKKREGIYSPVTQNKRHMELIKQIRSAEQKNIVMKALFEKNFDNRYRSIVVLANPKTVLNAKYAKKEVRDQVIRADQLSAYIRKINADPKAVEISEKDMEELAQFFLGIHKPRETDYTEKYRNLMQSQEIPESSESRISSPAPAPASTDKTEQPVCPRCGAGLVRRKATRGENAGKEFYGCTNFPKCRYINPISQ